MSEPVAQEKGSARQLPTGPIENPRALRLEGEQARRLRLLRGDSPDDHYPPRARADRIDGLAIVDLLLNEAGQVLEAQIITESPLDAGFGLAALDTAKTYEFENPYRRWVLVSLSIEFLP